MGRKRRQGKKGHTPEPTPTPKAPWRVVAALAVAGAAVALALMSWQSEPRPAARPAQSSLPPRPPAKAASPATRSSSEAAPETPAQYRPLLGEWVRPDGGYVLAVAGVAVDGTAAVAYFNPRPINVGRADARVEDDKLRLFVELQDRNYPGSTYTLAYDAEGDQLVGVYFQAVQRASYDVVFVRRP